MLGGNVARAVSLALVMTISFAAALLFAGGGIDGMRSSVSGGGDNVLSLEHFQFPYPSGWQQMPEPKLPAKAERSVAGSVVAGLCPGGSGKACGAPVDVSYVLFQEGGASFPPVAALERSLDGALPAEFLSFRKGHAQLRTTTDGIRYLTYEFSFVRRGEARHQLIAAYKRGGVGMLVVATGPTAEFEAHRGDIQQMLDGASERPAG